MIYGLPFCGSNVKTVIGVSKDMSPVKYCRSNNSSFFVSVEFHGDYQTAIKMR